MAKTKKNAVDVKNSIVTANDVNVVTEITATSAAQFVEGVSNEKENKEDSSSVLPLRDSSVLANEIEGERESAKKKECMDLIKNHFRAPVPSALVLFGRFFRRGCPCDSDVVKKIVGGSGLASDSDDSSVASWVLGLDAPSAGAFTRAANSWWRLEGDYIDTTVESVVDWANKNTSLKNDVYFCELQKDWLFVRNELVIYSGSNNDGKKLMFAPGCYYSAVSKTTENYIRAIGSLGFFLSAKRREMNGKVSNIFALRPAVHQYLKKILLAGFLSASDVANIANDVANEIESEKNNMEIEINLRVMDSDFKVKELTRQIDELKQKISATTGTAKIKKLSSDLQTIEQKLSAAKTELVCALKDAKEFAANKK